ncbi:MAG: hypothetical protein ACLRWP_19030 [Bilophila wadsworthia]
MDFQTSLNRIEELFRIMYLGLWVLWAETRWIAGPDIGYQRRLTLMRAAKGPSRTNCRAWRPSPIPGANSLRATLPCLKAISSGLKKTGKPTAPGTSPRSAPGSGGCFKADGR